MNYYGHLILRVNWRLVKLQLNKYQMLQNQMLRSQVLWSLHEDSTKKTPFFFFRFFFTTFWHLFPPNPQVAMLNSTAPFPWPQGQRTTNEQPTTTNPPTPDGRVGRLEPPRWKWIIGNSPGRRNRKRPVAKPWVWRAQESAKRKGDIGGVFKFGWGKNVEWFLSFKKEKTPVIKKKHLLVGFLFEQNWWKKVMEIHGY